MDAATTHLSLRLARFVFLCAVILGLALWLAACSGESDYKPVDFRRTADLAAPGPVNGTGKQLNVAVAAMVSPQETFIHYREMIDYLGAAVDRDMVLVQRRTYGEINQMLASGQLDMAFLCTGPFVSDQGRAAFEAIATPVVRGQPFYRAYLIVHRDSRAQSLADLQGQSFAFTDPQSNTGALVPRAWLRRIGQRPETFFRTLTYTYSHDNSILAVAKGLVDGAAVDGLVYEYYRQRNPFYAEQTRVIDTSAPFGSPPVVVARDLEPQIRDAIAASLLKMHEAPRGHRILNELMIDRFVAPEAEWYRSAEQLVEGTEPSPAAGDGG